MNGRPPLGAVGHLRTGLAKFRGKKINRIEKIVETIPTRIRALDKLPIIIKLQMYKLQRVRAL